MYHTPRSHWQLRLTNLVFVLLFLVAIGMLQWLSREYVMSFDLTRTGAHSLTEASIAAMERLKGPVTVTAYASQREGMRPRILEFIKRYQRHKDDLTLRFVDPDASPNEVRAAGVRDDGELVVAYADTIERITSPAQLTEENFTNALVRLGHRGERWIVFLSGHGERSPERPANFDVSNWAGEMRKRGFEVRELTLAESAQIPQNTSVLVIAGPRVRLLAGEVRAIQKYVEDGGNLLWLVDPEPLQGLQPLAEMLGIELLPGTIVDLAARTITGKPDTIIVGSYSSHPTVRDFAGTTITLFPQAGALDVTPRKGWNAEPLFDTPPSAWLETGPLNTEIEFNKGRDKEGPLTVGVALTRALEKRNQRVVVIADGDFLSNTYLPNAGNLDLGMSIINWLSGDDAYVNIPVRAAPDRQLELSYGVRVAFVGVFLVGLPLAFVLSGAIVWWRRRKR